MDSSDIPEFLKQLQNQMEEAKEKAETEMTVQQLEMRDVNTVDALIKVHDEYSKVHVFKSGDIVQFKPRFCYKKHAGPYIVVNTRYNVPEEQKYIYGINPVPTNSEFDPDSPLFGIELDIHTIFIIRTGGINRVAHQWLPSKMLMPAPENKYA